MFGNLMRPMPFYRPTVTAGPTKPAPSYGPPGRLGGMVGGNDGTGGNPRHRGIPVTPRGGMTR